MVRTRKGRPSEVSDDLLVRLLPATTIELEGRLPLARASLYGRLCAMEVEGRVCRDMSRVPHLWEET